MSLRQSSPVMILKSRPPYTASPGTVGVLPPSYGAIEPSFTNPLLKGFTGRGRVRVHARKAQRLLADDLAIISHEIEQLRKQTLSVEWAMWVLVSYRRHTEHRAVCDHQLRWRYRDSNYVTWESMQIELVNLPTEVQQWYVNTHAQAEVLNALWRLTYRCHKTMQHLLSLPHLPGDQP